MTTNIDSLTAIPTLTLFVLIIVVIVIITVIIGMNRRIK